MLSSNRLFLIANARPETGTSVCVTYPISMIRRASLSSNYSVRSSKFEVRNARWEVARPPSPGHRRHVSSRLDRDLPRLLTLLIVALAIVGCSSSTSTVRGNSSGQSVEYVVGVPDATAEMFHVDATIRGIT